MPEEPLQACAYHILRYVPNLVRDEWVNIGVLVHHPATGERRLRLMDEVHEFARVRRLHPDADEKLLRALGADFEAQFAEHAADWAAYMEKLNQTLSNALQLSPQKGVLTRDLDAELERLYRDHVEPPRYRAAAGDGLGTRSGIRARILDAFRSARVLDKMERGIRVEEFTYRGDPLRIDFGYRRNGTRGFVQSLPLSRDPAQAKVLAYTAGCIRSKMASCEFVAVADVEPRPEENDRHRFVAGLLGENQISVVPVHRMVEWAHRLRPTLH